MGASAGFKDLLIDPFRIYRETRVVDAIGGFSTTFVFVEEVSGRLSITTRSMERIVSDNSEIFIPLKLFIDVGANVQRNDIIRGESKKLRVLDVLEPSGMEHHLELNVEQEDPERDFTFIDP